MKIEVNLTEMRIRPDLARSAIVALLAALPRDEAELALLEWSTLKDLHHRLDQQGSDLPLFIGPLAAGRTLPQTITEHTSTGAGEPAALTPTAAPSPAEPEPVAAPEPVPVPPVKPVPPSAPPPIKQPVPLVPPPTASAGAAGAAGTTTVPPPTVQPSQPTAAAVPPPVAVPTARAPVERMPEPTLTVNGADPFAAMSLRELVRHAEMQVQRDRVLEVLRGRGVVKLTGVEPSVEAMLRADFAMLLS